MSRKCDAWLIQDRIALSAPTNGADQNSIEWEERSNVDDLLPKSIQISSTHMEVKAAKEEL